MSQRTLWCPSCSTPLDPTQPECQHCGEVVRIDPRELIDDVLLSRRRRRFPVPWGLFILLGLYFGSIWLFLRYEYYNAPEYKAARHLSIALQLLGDDDGLTAEVPELLDALDHMLAALSVNPDDRFAHHRVEAVVRRLNERNVPLPDEKQKHLDALALRFRRLHELGTDLLAIGPRDMWDVDYVLEMPARIARFSIFGGLIIFVIWFYKSLQDRRYLDKLAAERMEERREEIAEAGAGRRRKKR